MIDRAISALYQGVEPMPSRPTAGKHRSGASRLRKMQPQRERSSSRLRIEAMRGSSKYERLIRYPVPHSSTSADSRVPSDNSTSCPPLAAARWRARTVPRGVSSSQQLPVWRALRTGLSSREFAPQSANGVVFLEYQRVEPGLSRIVQMHDTGDTAADNG